MRIGIYYVLECFCISLHANRWFFIHYFQCQISYSMHEWHTSIYYIYFLYLFINIIARTDRQTNQNHKHSSTLLGNIKKSVKISQNFLSEFFLFFGDARLLLHEMYFSSGEKDKILRQILTSKFVSPECFQKLNWLLNNFNI